MQRDFRIARGQRERDFRHAIEHPRGAHNSERNNIPAEARILHLFEMLFDFVSGHGRVEK